MENKPATVFVHIVTYNSNIATLRSIESVLAQEKVVVESLFVTDNASSNSIVEQLENQYGSKIGIERNQKNLGFCGAHNQGAKRFLDSNAKYFLVLNPDVRLTPNTLSEMIAGLERHAEAGLATPRLQRADNELNVLNPARIDACGMRLSLTLRHFDRGSNESVLAQYAQEEFVFGGTGACLLLSRKCLEDLLITAHTHEDLKAIIEPALLQNQDQRVQLFDEAFFAYREDADLCWRANILGWKCVYVPSALAYHTRAVLPERRNELSSAINLMGVRNRFLLQLNNFKLFSSIPKLLCGVIFRNLIVVVATLLVERKSRPALKQVIKLAPRALDRRRIVFSRVRK